MASTRTRTRPTASAPVLTLSTVIDRPQIAIDGRLYSLRHADELPWLVYRDKANVYRQAAALFSLKTRSAAQERELQRILPPLVASLVVDAPATVLRKLTDDHRLAIVATFSNLLLTNPHAAGAIAQMTRTGRGASTRKTGAR